MFLIRMYVQEFMILPVGASSFKEAMKMGVEVYHHLKVSLHVTLVCLFPNVLAKCFQTRIMPFIIFYYSVIKFWLIDFFK